MSDKKEDPKKPLAQYRLLGKTGLRVSPICLGSMSFGEVETWKWAGSLTEEQTFKILDAYVAAGGNFIDTANVYQAGVAETFIGNWLEARKNREEIVLATKFSGFMKAGAVNSAGNSRKNMFQAVEHSLQRLKTTYIDLYYVHFWDFTTDITELMRACDDLVKSGKVLHVAISDCPAWKVAQGNTWSEAKGMAPFVAFQGRYSLIDRAMERDVNPMCNDLGLAIIPWGVVGQGKLTGKYKRGHNQKEVKDAARNAVLPTMTDKEYDVSETVCKIAEELKRTPAQVALNWILQQKNVPSALIGVRSIETLNENIKALEFTLSKEHMARLNEVSAIDLGFPHNFIGTSYQTCPWIKPAGVIV
jgi:aryl-alcohol dehydrogenase-like predicted oxidoreductase